jgi:DNA repair photolyase
MPPETKKPRKVITSYLIYCNKKPVLLTRNKKEAEAIIQAAKEQGHDNAFYKDLTATEERMEEIGRNLFITVKAVPESHIERILEVRSKLIRETFEMKAKLKESIGKRIEDQIAWEYLTKKKYGAPYNKMTYQEFNSWTLDINEFFLDINR